MRLAMGMTVLAAFLAGPACCQEKKDEKPPVKARRLPQYFKSLGLTPEQKTAIYKIQAESKARIDALAAQLAKAKLDAKAELNKVLTPEQRKKLRELQTGEKDPEKAKEKPPTGSKDGATVKDKKVKDK
jgi:Spy/CpxP family protein refolding chaperone